MDIDFIEIMLTDYTLYRIEKNNIIDCFWEIEEEKVKDTDLSIKNIPIVKSLMLIIKDINRVICYDTDSLDYDSTDISQIAIYKEDGMIISGYVDLTEDIRNKNQKNYTNTEGHLYLTIEEE